MATFEKSSYESKVFKESVRIYLEIRSAYDQCDEEVREVIDEMVGIVSSENATDDEKESATLTIVEALFPSWAVDVLDHCERVRKSPAARARSLEMAEEQRLFADRVQARMTEVGATQESLAESIGIGQPAISNLLNRKCRPQKRTVLRIAKALEFDPEELWPGINPVPSDSSTSQ
jgi:lambda repressor-like predicted transcriptional regulator